MRVIKRLLDKEYPYVKTKETRAIVRALLLVDKDKFLFHHLYGDDIFGHRDYLETPGGGVEEGEDLLKALKRECLEETGYQIEIIAPIGIIEDYYNLIERKNINHYYLVRAVGEKKPVHFVSKGDAFIKETLALTLDEASSLYKEKAVTPIARLLYNRELPVIEEARTLLLSSPFSCAKGGR